MIEGGSSGKTDIERVLLQSNKDSKTMVLLSVKMQVMKVTSRMSITKQIRRNTHSLLVAMLMYTSEASSSVSWTRKKRVPSEANAYMMNGSSCWWGVGPA